MEELQVLKKKLTQCSTDIQNAAKEGNNWGGGSICRWWGNLTTIGGNQTFCGHMLVTDFGKNNTNSSNIRGRARSNQVNFQVRKATQGKDTDELCRLSGSCETIYESAVPLKRGSTSSEEELMLNSSDESVFLNKQLDNIDRLITGERQNIEQQRESEGGTLSVQRKEHVDTNQTVTPIKTKAVTHTEAMVDCGEVFPSTSRDQDFEVLLMEDKVQQMI